MRLKEYTQNDITLKYVWQPSKNPSKHMIVVLTNPIERDGFVEYLFSLQKFKNVSKLFLASANDYRFGNYLIKDTTYILRDTVESLIEYYQNECNVDNRNVWMLGFCASSLPVANIAVNKGYNAVFAGVIAERGLYRGLEGIKREKYINSWEKGRGKDTDISLDEYWRRSTIYIGRTNNWNERNLTLTFFDNLYEQTPEKLQVPRFYIYVGHNEEVYRNFGKESMERLDRWGINYHLYVDQDDFDHSQLADRFARYFSSLFESFGFL